MAELSAGDARYRDDHGVADQAVAAALAAFAAGTGGEHAVLTALTGSRLLVPVVAVLADDLVGAEGSAAGTSVADTGASAGREGPGQTVLGGGEKASEMAMPKIVGRDGRQALPAFTCLDAVQRWRPAARPVPVPAAGVWQSAVQESCAVVIDIAGPFPSLLRAVGWWRLLVAVRCPACTRTLTCGSRSPPRRPRSRPASGCG